MSRKKINQEDLYEDEKAIPAEENNCFGIVDGKCEVLASNKMSKKDKINCGTMRCPFYKPKEHEDSVKHLTEEGVYFETYEEFTRNSGIMMIRRENFKDYETYPHAESNITDEAFYKYVRKERCFDALSLADLREYAKFMDLSLGDMNKKEAVAFLANFA